MHGNARFEQSAGKLSGQYALTHRHWFDLESTAQNHSWLAVTRPSDLDPAAVVILPSSMASTKISWLPV